MFVPVACASLIYSCAAELLDSCAAELLLSCGMRLAHLLLLYVYFSEGLVSRGRVLVSSSFGK